MGNCCTLPNEKGASNKQAQVTQPRFKNQSDTQRSKTPNQISQQASNQLMNNNESEFSEFSDSKKYEEDAPKKDKSKKSKKKKRTNKDYSSSEKDLKPKKNKKSKSYTINTSQSDIHKSQKRSKKNRDKSNLGLGNLKTQDVFNILGQLKSETQILRLDQFCQQLDINQVTEFRYSRVTDSPDVGGGFLPTSKISQDGMDFQLFSRESYSLIQMNPYQLAIVYNNLKALKYLLQRFKCHYRLVLMAPSVSKGAMQMNDSTLISEECWSLFVAIDYQNIEMLKYLWEELDFQSFESAPKSPLNNQKPNQFKLQSSESSDSSISPVWNSSHLIQVVQKCCKHSFVQGLMFIMKSRKTQDIYNSMPQESKVYFLSNLVDASIQCKFEESIRQAILQTTSEHPYATLSLFTSLFVNRNFRSKADLERCLSLNHLKASLLNISLLDLFTAKQDLQSFKTLVNASISNFLKQTQSIDQDYFQFGEQVEKTVNNFPNIFDQMQNMDGQRALPFVKGIDLHMLKDVKDYKHVVTLQLFKCAYNNKLQMFQELMRKYRITNFQRIQVPVDSSKVKLLDGPDSGAILTNHLEKRVSQADEFFRLPIKVQLPTLSDQMQILQSQDEIIGLTPLHIAIMEGNLEMVKYIVGLNQIDISHALTAHISHAGDDEAMQHLFSQHSNVIEQPQFFQDVCEEQQSFGLLIACNNKDKEMLAFLWDKLGPFIWQLQNLGCVIQQLIADNWCDGMDLILQSRVTHLMIETLESEERSQFIYNYIGDPLDQDLSHKMQKTIISNLCAKPYSGSLLIYLVDNFEELSNQYSKKAQQSKSKSNILLFENMWTKCLDGVYSMEIQVLKSTNEDKFKDFITERIHNESDNSKRNEALKLIKLFQNIPNLSMLLQENEEQQIQPGGESSPSPNATHNSQESNRRNARIIESSWTNSPEFLRQFITATINGDVFSLRSLVDQHGLQIKDILEMRGVECKAFCEIPGSLGPNISKGNRSIIIETSNWNPLHFAVFYQQRQVIQFFNQFFGNNFDIRYGLSMQDEEIFTQEGVIVRFKNQSVVQQQKVIKLLLQGRNHLYGFLLAMLNNNIGLLHFLIQIDGPGIPNFEEIIVLIQICQDLKLKEGLLTILSSQNTQKIFLVSSLDEKIEFINQVMSRPNLKQMISIENANDDNETQERNFNKDPTIQDISKLLHQFPYIIASWRIYNTSEPNRDNDSDFSIYINELKNSFDYKCVEVLEQMNQTKQILDLFNQKQIIIQPLTILKKKKFARSNSNVGQKRITLIHQNIKVIIQKNVMDPKHASNEDNICSQIVQDILLNYSLDDTGAKKQFVKVLGQNIKFIGQYQGFEQGSSLTQSQHYFKGIHIEKMNLLHWVIYSKRNQIFDFLIQKVFTSKQASKFGEVNSVELSEKQNIFMNASQVAIQKCLNGDEDSFYDNEFNRLHKIKRDSNFYSFQIKPNLANSQGSKAKSNDQQKMNLREIIKIQSLGIVLMILSRNLHALEGVINTFKNQFYSMGNDIIGAVFLCFIKQWQEGIKVLAPIFEVAFAKLSLLEKFSLVIKIFGMMQTFQNDRGVIQCIDLILSLPKVVNYIDWQEKNPQMTIFLKIYVRQLFSPDLQACIKQSQDQQNLLAGSSATKQDLEKIQQKMTKSEMVDDDNQTRVKNKQYVKEAHVLEQQERQNFFNGVYSTNFQNILMNCQRGETMERDKQVLQFLAQKIIHNKL